MQKLGRNETLRRTTIYLFWRQMLAIRLASAERGDDVDLVRPGDRRIERARHRAVDVEEDRRPDAALLVDDAEAEARVAAVEVVEQRRQCRAGRVYLRLVLRVGVQRGRDVDDGHQFARV